MRQDEGYQQELEIQERIQKDPEYRAEYEAWLDSFEQYQPTEKEMKCQISTQ